MHYSQLGNTDLPVSSVSFGSAPLGGVFGAVDNLDAAQDTINVCLDAGINLFDTSPFYGHGLAEERLGQYLGTHRKDVFLSTKAGRYATGMDVRPERIRTSLHESLKRLQTDYVDLFMLHDIEYAHLATVFEDSFAELIKLKHEGLCRHIGVTGYPIKTMSQALLVPDMEVVLNYAHASLLNSELSTKIVPAAREYGIGVINASSVHLGFLTSAGSKLPELPALPGVPEAAVRILEICKRYSVDIAFLAHQFAIQRSECDTTLIGSTQATNMRNAISAATLPINEDLLVEVQAAAADVQSVSWVSGLPENN